MVRLGLVGRGTAGRGEELLRVIGSNTSFDLRVDQPSFEVHTGGPTDLEMALYRMLEEMELDFIPEWNVPGTRYRVDAFVPAARHGTARRAWARSGSAGQGEARQGTAYEADGPMHRGREERDRKRDQQILATGYVDRIVRLGYKQLRPWL